MTIITQDPTVKTEIMGFEKLCSVGAVHETLLHEYVMTAYKQILDNVVFLHKK